MKIINCRVNHIINPIGYLMETPVFSYVVDDAKGKKQKTARIRVAEDKAMSEIIADTGFNNLNSLATKIEVGLKPRTRYFWTVEVESDLGEKAVSDVNYFETSKMSELWIGSWIASEGENERHPIFSKTFTLQKIKTAKQITAARLYISGLGLYQASINGKKVTEEKLTPYCNDYNEWIQYQTFDVTEFLLEVNTIEILVGRGWYSGRFGIMPKASNKGFYGDDFLVVAELRVCYEDGSEEVIGTDESWSVTRSNIIFSGIYDGEHVDDTLKEENPEKVVLAKTKGELTARMSLPVYAHEEFPAIELMETPAGEKVFDLGQNMAGGFRLHVNVPKGTQIHIQFGEVLQQGNFYNDNLRTAKAEYYYVSDGVEKDIEPVFTYYGYRYAKVEGVNDLKKEDFAGIAYYSDITPIGSLHSGDEKLNQLLSNISWGQKSNFIDVPTDCPQRDERMGWTADTQVFVPTASFMTDSVAFYRKYLYDLRKEQMAAGGKVPDVIPSVGLESFSSVWGDCATIIPWFLYLYSGDVSILEESLDSMISWVEYIRQIDGENHHWRDIFHYGDWLALDNPNKRVDQMKGGTEEGYIADIYYMQSAEILAKSAGLVGKEEIQQKYSKLAAGIRKSIVDEYFTATGRCAITTQTGYLLALRHGLTSDREKTIKALVDNLEERGNKLETGFVGTPFLNIELTNADQDKLAYIILHNEEYPGWLYEINLGATTVWERWNSLSEDGSVSSTGMNSLNHYAYGSIGEWMWRAMGGISPVEECPGFKKALIRPVPDYSTKEASAEYHSPAGTYKTCWEVIDANHVHIKVEVPFDCMATLILPYAKAEEKERELEAGCFEITYELVESLKEIYTVDTPLKTLFFNPAVKECLMKAMPDIAALPDSLHGMSIKQVILQYVTEMSEKLEEQLNGINLMLSQF